MIVTKGMYELPRLAAEYFCQHDGEECVACDVKRYPKENVGTTLVELQAHLALFNIYLIEVMADRKSSPLSWLRH